MLQKLLRRPLLSKLRLTLLPKRSVESQVMLCWTRSSWSKTSSLSSVRRL